MWTALNSHLFMGGGVGFEGSEARDWQGRYFFLVISWTVINVGLELCSKDFAFKVNIYIFPKV